MCVCVYTRRLVNIRLIIMNLFKSRNEKKRREITVSFRFFLFVRPRIRLCLVPRPLTLTQRYLFV